MSRATETSAIARRIKNSQEVGGVDVLSARPHVGAMLLAFTRVSAAGQEEIPLPIAYIDDADDGERLTGAVYRALFVPGAMSVMWLGALIPERRRHGPDRPR